MVINELLTDKKPFGRDVKREKANFFNQEVPSWLTLPSNSVNGNGFLFASGTIETCLFDMSRICAASFAINNLKDSDVTIGIKNENESQRLYVNGTECLYYEVDGQVVETVEMEPTHTYSLIGGGSGQAGRPKNIEFLLEPELNHFDLLRNGYVVFNKDDMENFGIDYSGNWKFFLTGTNVSGTSIELTIYQNK